MGESMLRERLIRSSKLIIKRSPIHRWGVFAVEPIKQYEILEEAPYFHAEASSIRSVERCYDYSYWLDDDRLLIGMGLSGLYNHAAPANTAYEVDKVNEVMRHYAVVDIAAGEELTLDYGSENAEKFAMAND